MNIWRKAIIFWFLGLLCSAKLYQVVSLLTPGARFHINDLYDGNTTKDQWGQLSSVGMAQHQNLGLLFRKNYIANTPFLSSTFLKPEISVFSTTSNRSIQSALSNLYGLYPAGNGQKLIYVDKQYHLPPFSYKTDVGEQNYALPKGVNEVVIKFNRQILIESCGNFEVEVEKNMKAQTSEWQEMNLTYNPFMRKMGALFNISSNELSLRKMSALFDTLNVDQFLKRPLPQDLTSDDLNNLQHLHNWNMHFIISKNLSRMYNTYKFNKILADFDGRIKAPQANATKWTTLAADEQDFVAAQVDLNISSSLCIEELYRKGTTAALNCEGSSQFASSIIFELHSDNEKDFYVQVRNNGKYINLCGVKNTKCLYSDWKARITKYLIANVEEVCGKPKIQTANQPSLLLQ